MFEVKIAIRTPIEAGVSVRTHTIATFAPTASYGALKARRFAIDFARAIDPEFEVSVIEVENEDNRDKAFGLVWGHVPGDGGRVWDGAL
jgi:hypothetical protein